LMRRTMLITPRWSSNGPLAASFNSIKAEPDRCSVDSS
jgi:hypothetical protein